MGQGEVRRQSEVNAPVPLSSVEPGEGRAHETTPELSPFLQTARSESTACIYPLPKFSTIIPSRPPITCLQDPLPSWWAVQSHVESNSSLGLLVMLHNTSACSSHLHVQPRLHIHGQRLAGTLCNLCASCSPWADTHGGGISLKQVSFGHFIQHCVFLLSSGLLQEECTGLRPRLCVIQRGSNGYGFNLHSERARPGQYIRAVDEDSPAERAGLHPKDRIVQVLQWAPCTSAPCTTCRHNNILPDFTLVMQGSGGLMKNFL